MMRVIKSTVIVLLVMLSFSVSAQRGEPRWEQRSKENIEKIKSLKISFLTEYLELTPAEAQNFWPIFNEMEGKRAIMFQKHMTLKKTLRDNDDFKKSDKECLDILKQLGSFSTEDAQLREEYNKQFLKVLSPQKVLKLYVAEEKFRHHLMKQYRGGPEGNHQRN